MSLYASCPYEPLADKENYTEEDIAEIYQQAMDRYVEEERADYDAPPGSFIDEKDLEEFEPGDYTFFAPRLFDDAEPDDYSPRHPADRDELLNILDKIDAMSVEAFEKRPPFNEEAARAEFREKYINDLENPDMDLPDWVREVVDPRILAMDLMPEKIYRKLAAGDKANKKRFDVLARAADEAYEARMKELPRDYREFTEVLEDLEESCVVRADMESAIFGEDEEWFEILMVGWSDQGKEVPRTLKFMDPEFVEDEGLEINAWDEDGCTKSDGRFICGELYLEDGIPEIHMLFENNGLRYLTLRCSGAVAEYGWNNERCRIGIV